MGKENPLITLLKIISVPIVPFVMLWVKLYSFIAYLLTTLAHMLTLGKFPVTRNPLLVLLSLPVIQIMIIPGTILLLIYGVPKEEAVPRQVEKTFSKYEQQQSQSEQFNYIILQ